LYSHPMLFIPHIPFYHCSSLFLILRRHSFTLFPYTTLFRSDNPVDPQDAEQVVAVMDEMIAQDAFASKDGPIVAKKGARIVERTDRKSTRLNSSHVSISYAVFCLKKKNSTRKIVNRRTLN